MSEFEGESDWDAIGSADKDMGTGQIKRRCGVETHFFVPDGEWTACRSAAASGLTAFRAWIAASGLSAEKRAWWAARPDAVVECLRQGALGMAP